MWPWHLQWTESHCFHWRPWKDRNKREKFDVFTLSFHGVFFCSESFCFCLIFFLVSQSALLTEMSCGCFSRHGPFHHGNYGVTSICKDSCSVCKRVCVCERDLRLKSERWQSFATAYDSSRRRHYGQITHSHVALLSSWTGCHMSAIRHDVGQSSETFTTITYHCSFLLWAFFHWACSRLYQMLRFIMLFLLSAIDSESEANWDST